MDAQSQSEHPIGKGISRRTLAQVLAAGAVAATAGAPAFAQQTSSMSEASPQDYVRDPTRWGSPEVAALFPGFKHLDMRTKGAVIRVRHGGSGPPLLLLHGNPNNHVLWYAVAARLAERYQVVLADLRGYGDSSLPEPGPNLINYSFRVMAEDMIEVMESLGHQRFFLAGHDRGARLSHRMSLDHPDRVMKLCLLDMLPNYYAWTTVNKESGHRRLALDVHGATGAVSRNDDQRRSGRMVPERPRQRQEPSQGRVRRIHSLLHQENNHRCVPRLSGVRHDRFRDGYGRQGQADRDAASDIVGNAGGAADAGISHRVAQVREQSRRCVSKR